MGRNDELQKGRSEDVRGEEGVDNEEYVEIVRNSMVREEMEQGRGVKTVRAEQKSWMGLGNHATVSGLRNLLWKEAPALVFLSETKLGIEEFRRVRASFDEYEGMEVDSVGRSGGLTFIWKKHVQCKFRSASVHHMNFEITGEEGTWRARGFYGWPSVTERHLSWELLRVLGSQYNDLWVCIGDFNEVLYATEMKRGVHAQWQMNNFREAVEDCGFRDVDFEGYMFIYDNGQAEEDIRERRIDRALCNEA
ncbi:uncharacterized protein LOC141600803 [Silene latifolia]|uniref:uncharacterized protein LOC141600803 n=1 Tax=Silene latifolia TaxID=37657 RepID=UPI003D77C1F3